MTNFVVSINEDENDKVEEQSQNNNDEAKELGVDLSALYTHKKPKMVRNMQEKMIHIEEKMVGDVKNPGQQTLT